MNEISSRIDELIRFREFSKRKFCEEIGINESTIRSWRRGVVPSAETIFKIAKFFDVSMEWIIAGVTDSESIINTEYQFFLNTEEVQVISFYRELDREDQKFILKLINKLDSNL